MTASHEPFKTKPKMPLTLDGWSASPQSPTRTTVEEVNIHRQHRSLNAPPPSPSSGSSRPHRTQSSSALLYRPLRVPAVVREDDAFSSPVGSPRRTWASTTITRPAESAERTAEEIDSHWWTEEIHKRREIRRRWREAEDENIVVIGNRVDTNHPNYVTAYNMLTGLRVAVAFILLNRIDIRCLGLVPR